MIISLIRVITTRVSPKVLYALCFLLSPLVVLLFSCPARLLVLYKRTRNFATTIPFNFGTHPFSLTADLYDLFGVPTEYRYDKKELFKLFSSCGFDNIQTAKLLGAAGWVVWGRKL